MNAITRLPFLGEMEEGADDQLHIPEREGERRRYRTIWISDIHLGTRGCNATMLIDFLDSVDSETIYLVGDIIDGWRLKKRFYWPQAHNDVVWRIMKRAKRGTRVVYIPGNHDEMFRQFLQFAAGTDNLPVEDLAVLSPLSAEDGEDRLAVACGGGQAGFDVIEPDDLVAVIVADRDRVGGECQPQNQDHEHAQDTERSTVTEHDVPPSTERVLTVILACGSGVDCKVGGSTSFLAR